jgi:hypothetical protein
MKRLLDTWDRNGSTSGPTAWQIYDDDDDDDDDDDVEMVKFLQILWRRNTSNRICKITKQTETGIRVGTNRADAMETTEWKVSYYRVSLKWLKFRLGKVEE